MEGLNLRRSRNQLRRHLHLARGAEIARRISRFTGNYGERRRPDRRSRIGEVDLIKRGERIRPDCNVNRSLMRVFLVSTASRSDHPGPTTAFLPKFPKAAPWLTNTEGS